MTMEVAAAPTPEVHALIEQAGADKPKDEVVTASKKLLPALSEDSLKGSVDVEDAEGKPLGKGQPTTQAAKPPLAVVVKSESPPPAPAPAAPAAGLTKIKKSPAAARGTKRSSQTSKFRGVSWFRANKVWKAQITVNGKYEYLGYFDNEKDAAWAYDIRALEVHGPLAQLNFPDRIPELMEASKLGVVPGKIKTKKKRKRASEAAAAAAAAAATTPNNERAAKSAKLGLNGSPLSQPSYMTTTTNSPFFGAVKPMGSSFLPSAFLDRFSTVPRAPVSGGFGGAFSLGSASPSLVSPNLAANPMLANLLNSPLAASAASFQPRPQPLSQFVAAAAAASASDNTKSRNECLQLLGELDITMGTLAQVTGCPVDTVLAWLTSQAGKTIPAHLPANALLFLRQTQKKQKQHQEQTMLAAAKARAAAVVKVQQAKAADGAKSRAAAETSFRSILVLLLKQLGLSSQIIQNDLSISPANLTQILPGGADSIISDAELLGQTRLLVFYLGFKLNQVGFTEIAVMLNNAAGEAGIPHNSTFCN